jgi:hypothetical protein
MYINIIKYIILLLQIRFSFLTFLPNGIDQLNTLLFAQRLSFFVYQLNINKCSFNDGPYCFFIEQSYIKSLFDENQVIKKDYIEKNWVELNNNFNEYSLEETLEDLTKKINNYFQRNLKEYDQEQKLPIQQFQIDITFDNFDSLTKNNDIYLDKKTLITTYSETIRLNIDGKVRLKYDKNRQDVKDIMDYPSRTYAIFESSRISLTLDGRNFRCISFFVRPKSMYNNDNYKITIIGTLTKNLLIEGYNNNKLVFSSNYRYSYFDEKYWTKIMINNDLFINKLVLPGNIEIDNICLSVENNNVYDLQSLFYNDRYKKTVELINDNDI